jgi:hypothetical protein
MSALTQDPDIKTARVYDGTPQSGQPSSVMISGKAWSRSLGPPASIK